MDRFSIAPVKVYMHESPAILVDVSNAIGSSSTLLPQGTYASPTEPLNSLLQGRLEVGLDTVFHTAQECGYRSTEDGRWWHFCVGRSTIGFRCSRSDFLSGKLLSDAKVQKFFSEDF